MTKVVDLMIEKGKLEAKLNNTRKVTYLTIIILVLIMLASAYLFYGYQASLKSEIVSRGNSITLLEAEVTKYIDKNGTLQNQVKALSGSKKSLEDNLHLLGLDNKELKKQVGSLNNIISIVTAKLEASGGGTTVIHKVDTQYVAVTNYPSFNWNDDIISIFGEILPDSVDIDYKVKPIELKFITYQKNSLFKKSKTILDISTEPQTNIISAQSYTVTHEEPFYEKWWVDLLAGFCLGYVATR